MSQFDDRRKSRRTALATGLVALGLVAAVVIGVDPAMPTSVAAPGAVPAPLVDEPVAAPGGSETALLAGGCFWGVQGVFQHVKGVTRAESGYAGGDASTATYDEVSTGTTGHAESVRVTYDPAQVTFGQLLQIFFTVVQDPTELDRQGPDEGTQYRSAIFAQDESQRRVASAYVAQLDQAAAFPAPIVTTVSPAAAFFPAERHHQDYLDSNPSQPYIARNDMPKVDGLKRLFPDLYRDEPVLVLSGV